MRRPPPLTALRLVGLAVLIALAVTACRPTPAPSVAPERRSPTANADVPTEDDGDPSTDGGTVRYAIAEPAAIVPVEAVGSAALTVVDALFDSLTYWGPRPTQGDATSELHPRPSAALAWSSGDDAKTWTFRLRPTATFHDGTPVTAADFVFAWELAVELDQVGYHLRDVEGYDALRAGQADGLAGVTAVDAHTLEVRLRRANADFAAVVGHPSLGPLPRELWTADPESFRQRPIGNGPFLAPEAWVPGQFVRVTPYGRWNNRVSGPAVAEVVFQILDTDTAYLAFQQGRLDFTELPPGALSDAIETYGESADGYTGPGVLRGGLPVLYYLGFDVTEPPFDDVEVRRAVSLAIDRTGLATEALEGNVTIARSLVPPVLPGFRGARCLTCRHDPEAAEEVFAERGITSLALWFNRGGGHERIAHRLRRDFEAVGVRLELRTEEFPQYLAALEAGDAGLFRFGWAVDYPTLENALYPILHSDARGGGDRGYNYGSYAASDVDALLDEARATLDASERHARYVEAAELALNRDQVAVPLFTYRHAAVASDRLDGLVYNAMGSVDLVTVDIAPSED